MKVRDLINEMQAIQSDEILMEPVDVSKIKEFLNSLIPAGRMKEFIKHFLKQKGHKDYKTGAVEEVADMKIALTYMDILKDGTPIAKKVEDMMKAFRLADKAETVPA